MLQKLIQAILTLYESTECGYQEIKHLLCVCLTESSAQLETVESLQELAVKIPYDVDCSWSDEAESLREIAVKTPHKLSQAFILKFFKSLRIVDKKVTDVCLF